MIIKVLLRLASTRLIVVKRYDFGAKAKRFAKEKNIPKKH
jgi:hypothetical protein